MELEERRQRMQERMQSPFEAPSDPTAVPPTDQRIANALEYIAYQLGQMNQTLARIGRNYPA